MIRIGEARMNRRSKNAQARRDSFGLIGLVGCGVGYRVGSLNDVEIASVHRPSRLEWRLIDPPLAIQITLRACPWLKNRHLGFRTQNNAIFTEQLGEFRRKYGFVESIIDEVLSIPLIGERQSLVHVRLTDVERGRSIRGSRGIFGRLRHEELVAAGILDFVVCRISQLHILEFDRIFAMRILGVGRDDRGLPARGTTVGAGIHRLTVWQVPLRTLRLDQNACIEPDLLVSRGAEVVVSKHGSQGPVVPLPVQERVDRPALNGRHGPFPVLPRRGRAEETVLRVAGVSATRIREFITPHGERACFALLTKPVSSSKP